MDFGKLLSRSWEIVWQNKFMFILGFLAALGAGGSGSGNFNFNTGSSSGGTTPSFEGMPDFMPEIEQFWSQFGILIIAAVCFLFLLGIAFWLLRLTAQAGMIESASRIDNGEQVTFRQAFAAGRGKLGSMLGLNVLMFGPFLLVGLIAGAVTAATLGTAVLSAAETGVTSNFEAIFGGASIILVCFGVLSCLLVPLYLLASLVYPLAQRGIVLRGQGSMASIRHSWQILRDNIGDVILLAVLFLAIGFVFGIATLIVLLPLAILSAGPVIFQLIQGNDIGVGTIVLVVTGFIIISIISAGLNSILVTYRSTAVTLAYEIFAGKTAVSEFDPIA